MLTFTSWQKYWSWVGMGMVHHLIIESSSFTFMALYHGVMDYLVIGFGLWASLAIASVLIAYSIKI